MFTSSPLGGNPPTWSWSSQTSAHFTAGVWYFPGWVNHLLWPTCQQWFLSYSSTEPSPASLQFFSLCLLMIALWTIAQVWKQPRCALTSEWLSNLQHTRLMECSIAMVGRGGQLLILCFFFFFYLLSLIKEWKNEWRVLGPVTDNGPLHFMPWALHAGHGDRLSTWTTCI